MSISYYDIITFIVVLVTALSAVQASSVKLNGSDANIIFGPDGDVTVARSATGKLTVTASTLHATGQLHVDGNVGIGTQSPSAALEVVGDIDVSGLVDGVDIAQMNDRLAATEATAPVASLTPEEVTGSDVISGDQVGTDGCAVCGDFSMVGSYLQNSNTGAMFVFKTVGGTTTQVQKILAPDAAPSSAFGVDVACSLPYMVIGAYSVSKAYVYKLVGSTFVWQQTLLPISGTGQMGLIVSMSADARYIALSAHTDSDVASSSGAVHVFHRLTADTDTWTAQSKITASDGASGMNFGKAVALDDDGSTLLIGSGWTDAIGTAYVFVRTGSTWALQQKVFPSDGVSGDRFGAGGAISGDTIAVGATFHANRAGKVYVYTRAGTVWSQQQMLEQFDAVDAPGFDYFGINIALKGNTVAVGAYDESGIGSVSSAGAVFLYEREGATFSPVMRLGPSTPAANSRCGSRLATDGKRLVSTCPGLNTNTGGMHVYSGFDKVSTSAPYLLSLIQKLELRIATLEQAP